MTFQIKNPNNSQRTIIVTGSAGLVGSACVRHFAARGFRVVGVDNDQRKKFFGTSTQRTLDRLHVDVPGYEHRTEDIRNCRSLFHWYAERDVAAIIHAAAQPSHDWAAEHPFEDFGVNAQGTLFLLEMTRRYFPKTPFVFLSTNKVYGDSPNYYAYEETPTRFESVDDGWRTHGICETQATDRCMHSLFGCSKLAADLYVQEYGRYFGMNTVCFRCGCLTGGAHAGAPQHGFLSYLVKCCLEDQPYTVIGYGGKQVRDNLHADDVASAIDCYLRNPRPAAVYNLGGGHENSCSVLEAIALTEEITGRKMQVTFDDQPRQGDHKWWISDTRAFRRDYPDWRVTRNLKSIVSEIAAMHSAGQSPSSCWGSTG